MARPGVKHSGTLCTVDNTQNKAGLGAGAAPGPDGRPASERTEGPAEPGLPAGRGRRGGPALPPAASWGFHKYLLNKETTAFAFPVIVALAPPPVGAGRPQALCCPSSPPPTGQCPAGQPSPCPLGGSQDWVSGAPGALQSGTQAPPLPQGLGCHSDQEFLLSGHLGTCHQWDYRDAAHEGGRGGLQAGPVGKGDGPGRRQGPRCPWAAVGGGQQGSGTVLELRIKPCGPGSRYGM